jgi:hypothetical protein
VDDTGRGRRWTNRSNAPLNAFDIAFDGRVSAGKSGGRPHPHFNKPRDNLNFRAGALRPT